ncbi:MAG: vancomycin resistance protein VanJ [Verrucomicrobiales bacterium]
MSSESVANLGGLRDLLSALQCSLLHRLRILFIIFIILAILFLGGVEWVGERNLFTVFFLFLPSQIWFLPLGMFFVAAACLFDWRLCGIILATTLIFVFVYMDVEMSGSKNGRGGKELVVLTFNRGQRGNSSLQPFKKQHDPDIIAMQEARGRSGKIQRAGGYEDLTHVDDLGEFMLMSKYPIVDKGLLDFEIDGKGHAIAAWFAVDFEGVEVLVYNVHLQTPREQLKAMRRGSFLRGLMPGSEKSKLLMVFWKRQIELTERLLAHIEAQERPVIVVGDFNTPDHGYIYRKVRRQLQDAHEQAGHGLGSTFPGKTRNPLTLFGPWLRIDHQFASDAWRVLDCRAESGRKSQHLSVVARYELVK